MERGSLDNQATGLPDHLLELVVECLCLPDLFRFGTVCRPWKSVCDPCQFKYHLPWLIVPFIKNVNMTTASSLAFDHTENVGFYSLRDEKIYRAELPQVSNRRICGSFPGGWLMTVHENSQIQLFHPFKSALGLINLPPLTTLPRILETIEKKQNEEDEFPGLFYVGPRWDLPENFCFSSKYMRDLYIKKVAISSTCMSKGTIIMAIQGMERSLVFYRIGGDQQVWSEVTLIMTHYLLNDLTYYKDKFYAVNDIGYVVVVNGLEETSHPLSVESIIDIYPLVRYPTAYGYKNYILESSGDLLVVSRCIELQYNPGTATDDLKKQCLSPHKTTGFKVFKIEFGTPNRWVEVESLGDRSLFLGYNSSFSIPSVEFSGCKPDCIYFTDDLVFHFYNNKFGGNDFGIFSLQDGSIEKFLYLDDNIIMPPPVWFAPNIS